VTLVAEWSTPEWHTAVEAWVDRHVERTGPLEQVRIRPWGVVLSALTTEGTAFFKACAPTTAFEAGLYALLNRVVPDHVLRPIALDVDAGWLLLPDGGTELGEQLEGEALIERLIEVVPQYAQMQVDLAQHVDELFALGVADMRPARMVGRFDEALDVARTAAIDRPDKAVPLERVAALREPFGRWCDRLASAPGAASLDHNDLHGGNVFVVDGHARFFDWGDAVVSHPFASALVLRSVVRWILGVHDETAQERRILDAYLEPFTALAPRDELRDIVEVACEVGKVARALVWARAVALLPPDDPDPDEFRPAPLEWTLELLDGPLARPSA
jgi:hypothetical protein